MGEEQCHSDDGLSVSEGCAEKMGSFGESELDKL